MIYFKRLIFLLLILTACESYGNLTVEGDISNNLNEVSAAELDLNSNILWTIQDAGNTNNLFGLNLKGQIVKNIGINNVPNIDWEELTSDKLGNIYIGDFGNNNKQRENFRILKIKHEDLNTDSAKAEIIEFTLPKLQKLKDFEAFFIYQNSFYLFSKEQKKFIVLKVPNQLGTHEAKVVTDFRFEGKNNKITSADISSNGKIIVLLNHDKLWKLTGFKGDDFFSGTIEKADFNHNSQKEGICFKTDSTIIITDERKGSVGGNIYSFKLD